jgi:predicted transcriptional regulator of viral defense system
LKKQTAVMKMFTDQLKRLIQEKGGVFSTADAVRAGVSKAYLGKLTRRNDLERIAPGHYMLPSSMTDDLYLYHLRCPNIVYSHETALFLLDYAERTPFAYSLTVPSKAYLPGDITQDCKVFYIKPELHQMGKIRLPTKMGHDVWCYDLERTICDLVRSRSRIDDQIMKAALKKYATDKTANFARLGQYAEALRVARLLRNYMEVLL